MKKTAYILKALTLGGIIACMLFGFDTILRGLSDIPHSNFYKDYTDNDDDAVPV